MNNKKTALNRILCAIIVLCCVFSLVPTQVAFAAELPHTITAVNGWGYAKQNATVYYESSGSQNYGSVGKGETFTIIDYNNNRYCINYSISSYPYWKEGWIDANLVDTSCIEFSAAGTINYSANTYYCGGSRATLQSGSVSSGERVAVIGHHENYYQIEYNTPNGRKCGWVPEGVVKLYYNLPANGWFMAGGYTPDYSTNNTGHSITVYQSPYITASGSSGTIFAGESYRACAAQRINDYSVVYVEYYYGNSANNQWKSGFIKIV